MMNIGRTPVSFKAWFDYPSTKKGQEALKKAQDAEENEILRKYIKANDNGDIYYELEGEKKFYSKDDAVNEIRKNLIDYIR